MSRQTPRARVESLAESLLDSERDITVTDARRHLSKLADTDVEYAAAKYLQEAVNRNRRAKRREAEKEAEGRRFQQWVDYATSEFERGDRRVERAKRLLGEHPVYRHEIEEVERHQREMEAYTKDPKNAPSPEPAQTVTQLERSGRLPATWRSKKFDDFTDTDWIEFRAQAEVPVERRDAIHYRKHEQYRNWDARRRTQELLDAQVELLAEEKLLAWTEDLLGAEFRLSDGTLTTWGAATLEQHRERVEMFTKNATASALGAGRHLQAVQELEAAKASTLNDLVAAPAAA